MAEPENRLRLKALCEAILGTVRTFFSESTSLSLTTERLTMTSTPLSNYQLGAGDSVVITITDTDTVTGAVVTPDPGSVTATLSSTTDTIVVDPSGTFATLTAGDTLSSGNTVTVNATVGGVASLDAVGTYDVVEETGPTPDPTELSLTFGTETPGTTEVTSSGLSRFNEVTGNWEAA